MDARLVIANFPGDMLEKVEKALERMRVERMNVCKVKGFGEYHDFFAANWLSDEVRVEVFTKKEEAEAIAAAIMSAAHTGEPGDGVVAIVPVEKLFLIRARCEATSENFWPRQPDAADHRPTSAAR